MTLARRARRAVAAAALGGAVLIGGASAWADKPAVYADIVPGVALGGYDAVAYFVDGAPAAGQEAYSLAWSGAEWRFASADNRARFAAAPEAYAPQYGGYCAWAVAQGYTAHGDPKIWAIVAGRLFLNYDQRIQRRWERDVPGNIARADERWPGVLAD